MNKVLAKIWHSKLVQQFVPDKLYLSLYFRKRFGYNMNWNNPQTFNEKIQWLKLYDRKAEYTGMVDKIESRDYISKRVGDKYLVKILGVYNDVNDIEYDSLPNRFVLKTTHDSGGVVVCKDKDNIDIETTNKILKKSLNFNYYWLWREWPYKNAQHKIICEEYLEDRTREDIVDYKVLCFNSEPKLIQTCIERNSKTGVKFGFYDTDWNKLDIKRAKHKGYNREIKKPVVLDEMLQLAKKLAQGFSFLRVDFYIVNDKLYVGELTFYPASGFEGFEPKEYDRILGDWLKLPMEAKNG